MKPRVISEDLVSICAHSSHWISMIKIVKFSFELVQCFQTEFYCW